MRKRKIDTKVKKFFTDEVSKVTVPLYPGFLPAAAGKPPTEKHNFRLYLPRAAAALLLTAAGFFLFLRAHTASPGPLVNTIASVAEEHKINEQITSGLMKAREFLITNL